MKRIKKRPQFHPLDGNIKSTPPYDVIFTVIFRHREPILSVPFVKWMSIILLSSKLVPYKVD